MVIGNASMGKSLKRSRTAVLIAFFVNGALLATWVSRIPTIQQKLSLSEGSLGLVLLGFSIGVLAALSSAGELIARFGSARVTLVGGIALCITIFPLAIAPLPLVLAASLFLFGATMSIMDVAMNDQAVMVEQQTGKPLMSSFHATFSIGGLVGALVGSGMAGTTFFSPLFHFLIVGFFLGLVLFFSSGHFLPSPRVSSEKGSMFRLPERALWMLGAVAFCSSIAEGSMADWSAVYLNQVLITSASFAALGFAGFSFTMTIGRLFGDALIARWSPAVVVRFGGLIASIGFIITVLTKNPIAAIAGFSVIGIGLANIIPVSFSSAGNFPGISPSTGIAGVATIGYAGFLAGPPLIGLIAEATSLRIAFSLVALLTASLIFSGKEISKSGNTTNQSA